MLLLFSFSSQGVILLNWNFDVDAKQWDNLLSLNNGHPLQSALWGEARRRVDGVEDRRWAAFDGGEVVWMGRYEIRQIPVGGRVVWIPRGPVSIDHPLAMSAHLEFLSMLKEQGYLICFTDPYPQALCNESHGIPLSASAKTLWLDLKNDKDVLFNNMHKKLRYGVRAAERAGVVLEVTRSPEDVTSFFQLCDQISETKQFALPGSEQLLQELLLLSRPDSAYKAHLFVARFGGRLVSGYLSIENGNSLHNIWNGTERSSSKQCPGEAVLWHQVAWGVDAGLSIYDQEGIDEENNPGCYKFKKRLGGEEVTLPGLHAQPFGIFGGAVLALGRLAGKL